jgi:DNA modification methylase
VNAGTLTGRANEVLAGNHTLLAARLLGWDAIDGALVDVDEQTARRIVAADNRLADLGEYDARDLHELLSSIDDLTVTGYLQDDLDALTRDLYPPEPKTDPDDVPDMPAEPVSESGQIWALGNHRLLVGDSTDVEAVRRLCGDVAPDCVWTDPPYGVEYVGKTKNALRIQNDGSAGLADLLDAAFTAVVAVCKPGAPVYVAHADTERITFESAMWAAGMKVRQNLVWVKNTMVLGRSDYHYKHEPILYGFTPEGEGRLGRGGERWFGGNSQTTVFEVEKPPRNAEHPTMKPVALIDAMLANSLPAGGVVLDPFGGSGSTLIAAHGRQARCFTAELDPRYADVILRRFEAHTGVVPLLDGEPVSFMAAA